VLIVGSAFQLNRKGGMTPGKAMVGLQVVSPDRQAYLRREFWRFMPLAVIAILDTAILPQIFIQNTVLFLIGSFAVDCVVFWYYIWPVIRWNGALRHDRITQTHVTRLN